MLSRANDPIPPQGLPPVFQEPRLFSIGGTIARGAAVGDLDNDGNLDVVVAHNSGFINGATGAISVLLNTGDWEEDGLGAPDVYELCDGCSTGWGVVIAELTGDAYLDIAVTTADGWKVAVFRNTFDGNGQAGRDFDRVVVDLPDFSNSTGIVAADFDREDGNDLGIALDGDPNNSTRLYVLYNNDGSGAGFTGVDFDADDGLGTADDIVLGRFDNHPANHLDLVTVSLKFNRLIEWGDGADGTFARKITSGPSSGAPFRFNSIAAGKLDNDQLREVVAVEDPGAHPAFENLYIDVFRHDPNGNFIHERGSTPDSGDRYAVTSDDLNPVLFGIDIGHINVGTRRDAVVGLIRESGGGHVAVLLGMGDGTFERNSNGETIFTQYSLSPSGGPTFGAPHAVLLADLNDDGQQDILATSGSKISVLLNDSAP